MKKNRLKNRGHRPKSTLLKKEPIDLIIQIINKKIQKILTFISKCFLNKIFQQYRCTVSQPNLQVAVSQGRVVLPLTIFAMPTR